MNHDFEAIIQAEIDGTATPEEIALLDAAAGADEKIRTTRIEHREIAGAVGRMREPQVPAGFVDRVMGALPDPATSRAPFPSGIRIASLLRGFVPVRRRQFVFAFAAAVVVVISVGILVTDLAQPGTDLVSGTVSGPEMATFELSGDAGTLTGGRTGDGWHVTVELTHARPLTIAVRSEGTRPPSVILDPASDAVTTTTSGDRTVLGIERAGTVGFEVIEPVVVRVESGGEVLMDWTEIPPVE